MGIWKPYEGNGQDKKYFLLVRGSRINTFHWQPYTFFVWYIAYVYVPIGVRTNIIYSIKM